MKNYATQVMFCRVNITLLHGKLLFCVLIANYTRVSGDRVMAGHNNTQRGQKQRSWRD